MQYIESVISVRTMRIIYTVKKVSDSPVPGRDVTNQTHPGQE